MIIECCLCRACFEHDKIEIVTHVIPTFENAEELLDWADEEGVRFDCNECSESQYITDCDIF